MIGRTAKPVASPKSTTPRLAIHALLWAGPAGVGLALALLLVGAPYFRHGPAVPTAGDERAWTALWGALALVGTGCGVGLVANVAWLTHAWRSAQRPSPLEWFRTAVNLLLGVGFLWLWFGG